jgi:uncharacterized protein YndB with AHSA1/START domain
MTQACRRHPPDLPARPEGRHGLRTWLDGVWSDALTGFHEAAEAPRQINGSWQFDPDPLRASEIEARFRADGDEQRVVEVEHRHFERLDGGRGIRDAIDGRGGWAQLLDGVAAVVAHAGAEAEQL